MYAVVASARAKRSLKRLRISGTFPLQKYNKAVEYLRKGVVLPPSYKDHKLHGDMMAYREFHLSYDLLVRYKRNDQLHVLTIMQVGTHAELFGR